MVTYTLPHLLKTRMKARKPSPDRRGLSIPEGIAVLSAHPL